METSWALVLVVNCPSPGLSPLWNVSCYPSSDCHLLLFVTTRKPKTRINEATARWALKANLQLPSRSISQHVRTSNETVRCWTSTSLMVNLMLERKRLVENYPWCFTASGRNYCHLKMNWSPLVVEFKSESCCSTGFTCFSLTSFYRK